MIKRIFMFFFLVMMLVGNTWALSVDFEANSRASTLGSPSGWESFNKTDISGDSSSQTFGSITVTITNKTLNDEGNLNVDYQSWTDTPYVPTGTLAALVQEHLYIHDAEGTAIEVGISGLVLDATYIMTTWHNNGYDVLDPPGMIDIYAQGILVVSGLQQSHGVADSANAASATFSFVADGSGNASISFVATAGTGGYYDGWSPDNVCLNGFTLVPEPGTVMLLGLGGLALLRRQRR